MDRQRREGVQALEPHERKTNPEKERERQRERWQQEESVKHGGIRESIIDVLPFQAVGSFSVVGPPSQLK